MKINSWLFPLLLLVAIVLYAIFAKVTIPGNGFATLGSDTVTAKVTQIIEEGQIEMGGHTQKYQVARVKILDGEYKDIPMEIDYGKRQVRSDDYDLKVGDKIMVSISKTPQNVVNAYFVDFVRTAPMIWLAVIFAAAIIVISRWKGVGALLSLLFSLYVIIYYIIPQILNGADPVRVSIIGSAVLLGVTLYLTYGWTLKTHAAVLSMVLVLVLTGVLSIIFVVLTRLNGTGDENVMYLVQAMQTPINLRGLLLGGMIIGALGVLDDLVTTQASAVFELHHANPGYGFRELYRSAMHIGQDHVAATVNTLVLAYAGTALPMLLLFSLARGNYDTLINYAVVAEEVVRTLTGSLGLIAAVPITTVIAIFFAKRSESLGRWEQVLGPEGDGHHH
jgi:uncharacterized membrane protein